MYPEAKLAHYGQYCTLWAGYTVKPRTNCQSPRCVVLLKQQDMLTWLDVNVDIGVPTFFHGYLSLFRGVSLGTYSLFQKRADHINKVKHSQLEAAQYNQSDL